MFDLIPPENVTFSGGIKIEHCREMGQCILAKLPLFQLELRCSQGKIIHKTYLKEERDATNYSLS